MNKFSKLRLIEGLVISEKSSALGSLNQYVIRAKPNATKLEIASAIELGFGVKVSKVNILNVAGKVKRFGRNSGKQGDWKKAYVTLKPGYTLDIVNR